MIRCCRLWHKRANEDRLLQNWLADSDSALSAQAYVLRPDVVHELSGAIVAETDPYKRTKAGAAAAIRVLRRAEGKEILVNPREARCILCSAQNDITGRLLIRISSALQH